MGIKFSCFDFTVRIWSARSVGCSRWFVIVDDANSDGQLAIFGDVLNFVFKILECSVIDF